MESLGRVSFLLLAAIVCYLFSPATVVEARDVSDGDGYIKPKKWCVAKADATNVDLQKNLDWACSQKGVDCGPIQPGAACSEPPPSRASFAMNSYYRMHETEPDPCGFIGTGQIIYRDPSYGDCRYI